MEVQRPELLEVCPKPYALKEVQRISRFRIVLNQPLRGGRPTVLDGNQFFDR